THHTQTFISTTAPETTRLKSNHHTNAYIRYDGNCRSAIDALGRSKDTKNVKKVCTAAFQPSFSLTGQLSSPAARGKLPRRTPTTTGQANTTLTAWNRSSTKPIHRPITEECRLAKATRKRSSTAARSRNNGKSFSSQLKVQAAG
ncbi:unnamed protein product, partial [Ectocarpus sp. 8 AP-2014]